MDEEDRNVDVSRRDLFGVLGAAASVAALGGCTNQAVGTDQGGPEKRGTVTDPLAAGSTPYSTIQEIRFPVTTATAYTCEIPVPANAIVTSARLDIVTPYSAGVTIQIGRSGIPAQLMCDSDNNPQAVGLYVVDQDTPWGTCGAVLITVSGAPIAGAAFCIVQFMSGPQAQQESGGTRSPYATWRGALNLPSTYGITMTQGGTIQSPAQEFPLVIQPRDPAKAPYQLRLHGFQFNSTIDDVLFFGYNADEGVSTEPICRFAIEQDFEYLPGQHQLECYFEAARIPAESAVRPLGFVIDRATGNTTAFVQYAGIDGVSIVGGPVGGPPLQQVKWTDSQMLFVPSNYVLASSNGLIIENLAGALDIRNTAGDLNLLGSLMLLAADRISLASADTTQQSIIDNNVSATRFYPTTDNTGSIGLSGRAWSTVFTHAINVAVTPATSATTGSSGETPDQVAGYMPITVDGTTYKVPLYNV